MNTLTKCKRIDIFTVAFFAVAAGLAAPPPKKLLISDGMMEHGVKMPDCI